MLQDIAFILAIKTFQGILVWKETNILSALYLFYLHRLNVEF